MRCFMARQYRRGSSRPEIRDRDIPSPPSRTPARSRLRLNGFFYLAGLLTFAFLTTFLVSSALAQSETNDVHVHPPVDPLPLAAQKEQILTPFATAHPKTAK